MQQHDGKASVPKSYRKWIANRYSSSMMTALDDCGRFHDVEVEVLGFSRANRLYRWRMRREGLPFWTVRLPNSIGVMLYRFAPNSLREKYWKWFNV